MEKPTSNDSPASHSSMRSKGRGRPKVVPDEAQRARIVEQGLAMFTEFGYARATMDELAARMHLSKQTLYRFFPGKAALFGAVIESHRRSMLALPGDYDDLPLDEALAAIFRIDINPAAERERRALIDVVVREAGAHPELRDALLRHGAGKSRAELAEWFRQQAERGRLTVDDPLAHAGTLMDMMFGITVRELFGESDEAFVSRRTHLRRCIAVFLNGVASR